MIFIVQHRTLYRAQSLILIKLFCLIFIDKTQRLFLKPARRYGIVFAGSTVGNFFSAFEDEDAGGSLDVPFWLLDSDGLFMTYKR